MGILNTSEVRPGIIAVLCKFLLTKDDFSYDEAKIRSLIEPSGIALKASEFNKTVRECETLKILSKENGKLKLNKPFSTDLDPSNFSNLQFVNLMRKQVLDESVNNKITDKWAKQSGARELTNSIAWYLEIDFKNLPEINKFDQFTPLQQRSFGVSTPFKDDEEFSNWPLTNQSRLSPFKQWMVFLGFGWMSSEKILIPDPEKAILASLNQIFAEKKDITAKDFRSRLAKELPVLEEGKYRKFVQSNYAQEHQEALKINTSHFSQSTSMALQTLVMREHLEMHRPSDDGALNLFDGTSFSRISLKQ